MLSVDTATLTVYILLILGEVPGFRIALFISRRGRVTTYRSIDDVSWWPGKADIVS